MARRDCTDQGQDTPWFLAVVAGAYFLLRRDRAFTAGRVLSLSTIKFHFLAFFPIVILVRRQWRLAMGAAAGVVSLIAVSFLVQGSLWVLEYYQLLTSRETHALDPLVPGIVGLIWPLTFRIPLHVLFVLAAILCVFRIASFWSLEVALSASLAAALMISPHSYIQDVMLLMPLALHAIARKAQTDWVAVWILSPVAAYALALWLPLIGPAMIVAPVCVLLAQFAVERNPKGQVKIWSNGADG